MKTIKLKSYNDIQNEYPAGGAILPGSLLALNANGEVVVNPTAGDPAPTMFAIEDGLQGKTTRQAYASGDTTQTWYVQPGEEALALVDELFDPSVGDLLEPAVGGELQAHDSGTPLFQVIGSKVVDDEDNHRVPVRRI